ncbi:MAG: hypothetical protein ACFFFC_00055 [Candidatus Thorarchaeota archaeon]
MDVFVSWQLVLISFCTFIILSTIKRFGTKKNKKTNKIIGGFAQSKLWKILQPVMPYLISLGIIFIPGVPLPDDITNTLAVKIMFGLVAGWMPDKSFQIVKNTLEKVGVIFPEKEKQNDK